MQRPVVWLSVLAVALVLVFACAPSSAHATIGARGLQNVTLIGDSVADGIVGDSQALAIINQGIALDLEVATCRRVDEDSCPSATGRPPNVIELVQSMGSELGPNVVVAVGYNDFEDQYAQNIEAALSALRAAGVDNVWWLTLRAAHHGYVNMNADIVAAAQAHPELHVIDWNLYSRSHPEWFQPDGIHLLSGGAEAMATLIHQTLLDAGVARPPASIATTDLPLGHAHEPYRASLAARGGLAPYAWSLLARAPKGIHLEASGLIVGRPVAAGSHVLVVKVTDSVGSSDVRRITLHVMR
jgi:hypothetical protein